MVKILKYVTFVILFAALVGGASGGAFYGFKWLKNQITIQEADSKLEAAKKVLEAARLQNEADVKRMEALTKCIATAGIERIPSANLGYEKFVKN